MKNILSISFLVCVIASLNPFQFASAVEILNVETETGTTKVSIGGYAKVDLRHVNGDIAHQDYWVANFPGGRPIETSHTEFNVRESRFNIKVTHGEVSGLVEVDYYGGGGNEVVSNSSNPRLRHFYINYKNWMVGQNWSTFMSLAALPEALDFGGPHVGEVFVRQTQVRYTAGPWQFAIENPETSGDGDTGVPLSAVGLSGEQADPDEATPDLIGRYNMKGKWGELSFSLLARIIDQGGLDETVVAGNIAGRIYVFEKDDIRFQVSAGDPGRYVAAGLTPDVVTNPETDELEVESTVAYTLAYRHFWAPGLRSTAFYGTAETDILERDRAHWGVNLINAITNRLDVGAEVGNYSISDEGIDDIDSNYFQISTMFKF
ncbi:DcaP family trimeric outer membrane transporter [Agarilytica rhodophyticola]|uniref:DcaP family trimeric outer membrane transporter n=1 Tax=Agarilytica rhodophyticola TaxID=1737490 RepID=UPI000B3483F1|nr:DcaP family trimeric outer membrane transporter [Agarilytica rhodophyticola]